MSERKRRKIKEKKFSLLLSVGSEVRVKGLRPWVRASFRVTFSVYELVNILGLGFVRQTCGPRLRIRAKQEKITKT